MRNKKQIRGKVYRYPRKLKKELKKKGEVVIWLNFNIQELTVIKEYVKKYNTTENKAIVKILEEYLDQMEGIK